MALNFRPYDDVAGRETRARWSRGLEGIMEQYLASKQNAQQQGRLTQQDAIAAEARANAEKDRQGTNLLQYGFDPRQVTPDVLARSQPGMAPQGPAQPGMQTPEQAENPLFGAVRSFLEKKKSAASMASQEQTLGMDKTRSEIRENDAQAKKLGREAGMAGLPKPLTPSEKASIEGQIFDDYSKSQAYTLMSAAKTSLRDLASIQNNKSGAGDIAAIYSFIKTMDPNAVKEGEIALTQSALPGLDRVKVLYDSMKSGNKITPEMKKELLVVAKGMYDAKLKGVDEFRAPLIMRAKQYEINPDIAVPSFAIPQNELDSMFNTQPQVRTLKDGTQVRVVSNGQGGWVEVP